jgi:amino acid transporter
MGTTCLTSDTTGITDVLSRGTGGIIWGTIAVWFFMIGLIASIAEMASMAPNSGGQYHW